MNKMKKKKTKLSDNEICYIKKIPSRLIIYISDFLCNIDINISDITKLTNEISRDIISLCKIFESCKSKYKSIIELSKLRYYLITYANKFYDVEILCCRLGINHNFQVPSENIKYSVVNINDSNYFGKDHGKIIQYSSRGNSLFTIVDEKFCDKLYIFNLEIKNVNYSYGDQVLLIIFNDSTCLDCINWFDRILFVNDYFPFLLKKDIVIKTTNITLSINTNLTIDKFKELINLEENRIVFKTN